MIDRELSLDEPNGPFGGICADAMVSCNIL